MGDFITNNQKLFEIAKTNLEMRLKSINDNAQELLKAALNKTKDVTPPTYTALERSRKIISDLASDSTVPTDVGQILKSANSDALFKDPLDLHTAYTYFKTTIDEIFKLNNDSFRLLEAIEKVFNAYHLFVGAASMLPDQLIPPLSISLQMGTIGPLGGLDLKAFAMDLILRKPDHSELATKIITHEFRHLLQFARGALSGTTRLLTAEKRSVCPHNFDTGILASIITYFPRIEEKDDIYSHITLFNEAVIRFLLLDIFAETETVWKLARGLEKEELEKFVTRLSSPIARVNISLVELLESEFSLGTDKLAAASKVWNNIGHDVTPRIMLLPPKFRNIAETIADTKGGLYSSDPYEVEIYALEGEPLPGNLFLLQETLGGSREMLQMPTESKERDKLFHFLTHCAERRQDKFIRNAAYGIWELLGGENAKTNFYDPSFYGKLIKPEYADISKLNAAVEKDIIKIGEHIRTIEKSTLKK